MGKIQKKRSAYILWESTPAVPRDSPGFRLGSERRTTDPQSGENPPRKPASRPVCGRERQNADGERRNDQKEEKHRFFSPIPAEYRRIYCKAGISAAVTSARNSGPRSRKTASLREIEGSDK